VRCVDHPWQQRSEQILLLVDQVRAVVVGQLVLVRHRQRTTREVLAAALRTVLGDMRDLSAFEDSSFDLVFNPVSNLFRPELLRDWTRSVDEGVT
jgi:hypothetical protein